MKQTSKKPSQGRPLLTPLGTQRVDLTLTKEVVAALHKIRNESDQGETTSHFVDSWLREHPQVKVKLEQVQEKGNES